MRQCHKCNATLTEAATFCPSCGTDVSVPVAPPAAADPGPKFCASCGAAWTPGARFCGSCGASTGQAAPAAAPPMAPPPPPPATPPQPAAAAPYAPPPPPFEAEEPKSNRNLIIGAAAAGVLLIGLLFWINRYSWLGMEPPPENASAAIGTEKTMYVVAAANLRDKPTSQGSSVVGKLARGAKVSGVLELGEDGTSNWLKIADTGQYVSAVNLSDAEPPSITRFINKPWYSAGETQILAKPQAGAPVLSTASAGTKYQLIGLTAGGFAEVLMEKGGVGYFDASGIDLAAGSLPPIDLAFNSGTCEYGKEINMLFRKLSQDAQARFDKMEKAEYPSDEARQAAFDALEGKSSYLPLNRSWMGLTIGGIGSHYESTSVYFKEPLGKVRAVFEKKFTLDSSNVFAASGDESAVSAGLAATSGDEAKYGQTSLDCGV